MMLICKPSWHMAAVKLIIPFGRDTRTTLVAVRLANLLCLYKRKLCMVKWGACQTIDGHHIKGGGGGS
jgi:hypothetical protein